MKNSDYSEPTYRDAVLHELGIGPVWRLRQSDSPLVLADVQINDINAPSQFTSQATSHETPQAIELMPWAALEDAVAACRLCDLCQTRTSTVFGIGDQRVKYLFVGEVPGTDEDLQGEPFVGMPGHLLDNMLRALGLQRDDANFITNVLKCRPVDAHGNDRVPNSDEVAACLPYLKRQIALIQPQMIVALGKTAAIALLGLDGEVTVAELRGELHHYQHIPLVVTYHPAHLLRKPSDKSKAWSDLCLAMRSL